MIDLYTNPLMQEEEDDKKEKKDNSAQFIFTKKFLEQRKIFLWGAVDDDSAKDVITKLMYLETEKPNTPITFYINSPGGMVTAGMAIYDTMKLISSPVHTVVLGLAASMGSILLAAGEKGHRYVSPHAEVMIHQPSLGGTFQGRSVEIETQAKQIKKTKELGAKILADACGKTVEQILKDFDRDFWMDAQEALAYGIADKIIDKI